MLCFFILPVVGGFLIRRSWRQFRRRFDELRAAPLLDYRILRSLDEQGKDFRFFGGFESVTDDKTLWVRSDNCTVAADLEDAKILLLPLSGGDQNKDAEPSKIRWNQISALSNGAGIYIGGLVRLSGNHIRFKSTKEQPLLIILYDGSERTMLARTIQAGRQENEYWNPITPIALALGVFAELFIALTYAYRPLYDLAFAAALVSAFTPLLPILPPGMFLTTVYKRFWKKGRNLRAARDLVRLPLRHLPSNAREGQLPDGSAYGYIDLPPVPPPEAAFVPMLPPDTELDGIRGGRWYGALSGAQPRMPADPTAVFAITAGDPLLLSAKYIVIARYYELVSGIVLILGLSANTALLFAFIRVLQ